jgi:hypothetical protein
MSNIKNTNIRFNLDKPIFRKAWDYLQGIDKSEYSSHSLLIATAINDFFERRDKNTENENGLVGQIVGAVNEVLEKSIPILLSEAVGQYSISTTEEIKDNQDDDISALIDFDFLGG